MCPMTPRIERIEGTVMAVNSYLVHGPGGIVVVDGQLTVSDAQTVRSAIERTGKDLAGILITHPHPDHYAGAGLIAPPAVPVLATAAVAGIIRRDDALKDGIVGLMMGEQWPTRPTPSSTPGTASRPAATGSPRSVPTSRRSLMRSGTASALTTASGATRCSPG